MLGQFYHDLPCVTISHTDLHSIDLKPGIKFLLSLGNTASGHQSKGQLWGSLSCSVPCRVEGEYSSVVENSKSPLSDLGDLL